MMIARIIAASSLALLASAGCASSSTAPTPAPEQDRGLEGNGESAASAPDTNPQGLPYPKDNLGTNARQQDRPGNRMVNYKFLGYPDGDIAQGLQPISMASFFDPTGTKYKLIHLQASGTWCTYCKQETRALAPLKAQLDERKVAWIISLAEGATGGVPATPLDLKNWVNQFKAPVTHFLDPGNKNLGPFYDAAALPWNANIDARTMEILSSSVGAATTAAAILGDLDDWLDKINSGAIKPQ